MADIALKRQSEGYFDLDFESNDLKLCDGLENATAISLGCFARNRNLKADQANLKPDMGGWWADALDQNGPLGGYLHEVWPGKLDATTLKRAASIAADSLAWLKEDGVAAEVYVIATEINGALVLNVKIVKPNGTSENFEYEMNWNATDGI